MHTGWMPHQEQAARPDRAPAGRSMSDAILDSAAALFSRRGYHAIGIRELADSVGLSTSTLYHYYATKQDILYAVIGRFLREFADTAGGRPARHVGAAAGQARAGRDRSRGPDRDPP